MAELGGDVFVGTDQGVTALDGGDGSLGWSEAVGDILEGGVEASGTGHVVARDEGSAYVFDPDIDEGGLVEEIEDVGSDGSLGSLSAVSSNSDFMYAVEPFGVVRFSESGEENRIGVDLENVDVEATDDYVVVGRRSGIDVYTPDLSELIASLDNENSDNIPTDVAPTNLEAIQRSGEPDIITFTGWDEEGSDNSVVYKAVLDVDSSLSLDGYGLEGNDVGDGVFVGGSELGVGSVEVSGGSVEEYVLEVSDGSSSFSESFGSVGELEDFDVYGSVLEELDGDDWEGDYEVELSVQGGGESDSLSKSFALEDLSDDLVANESDFTGEENEDFSVELDGYDLEDVDDTSIQWVLEGETLDQTGEQISLNVEEVEVGSENSIEAVLNVGPDGYDHRQDYSKGEKFNVEAPEIENVVLDGNDVEGDNSFIAGDSVFADAEIDNKNYADSFSLVLYSDGEELGVEDLDSDQISDQDLFEIIYESIDGETFGDYSVEVVAEYGDDQNSGEEGFQVVELDAGVEGPSKFVGTVEDEPDRQETYEIDYNHENPEAAAEAINSMAWYLESSGGDQLVSNGSTATVDEGSLDELGEYVLVVDSQVGNGESKVGHTIDGSLEYTPPILPGMENPPQDLDGDGLYEDVDGDGEFTIFDVQAFFKSFESDEVQQYSGAFAFEGDEEVDIFDVQALFEEL